LIALNINVERLLKTFRELAALDSPSGRERLVADYLRQQLNALGFAVTEDAAGQSIGGEAGNLIAVLPGNNGQTRPLLFCAHMDTVISNARLRLQVLDGVMQTDGKTILGADDKAGITAILECCRFLQEQQLAHGGIEIVFSVAEENGLYGAKQLDYTRLRARHAFVVDSSSPVGGIVIKSPTEIDFAATVHGRAAHAGIEPEKGVNAIVVASHIISKLPIGRLGDATTTNIGMISGGTSSNIVPEKVELVGEIRSHDRTKLAAVLREMTEIFQTVAADFGATTEFHYQEGFPAFSVPADAFTVQVAAKAAAQVGLKPQLRVSGGGSDTNIFNQRGIEAVNLGMNVIDEHTNRERVAIADLVKLTEWLVAIVQTFNAVHREGIS